MKISVRQSRRGGGSVHDTKVNKKGVEAREKKRIYFIANLSSMDE
jgi:hypothetical protein